MGDGLKDGMRVEAPGREILGRARRPARKCCGFVTVDMLLQGKLQELDSVDWGDLRPEFVKQVKQLRQKIYTSSPPKMLNGKSLDGSMIGWLAEAYSNGINEGEKLNIGDAWAQVKKPKSQKI